MNPAFTVKVGQQIFSGLVVTGKFDGHVPSLACGTTGGKILIHSPHETDQGNSNGQLNSVRFLNLNRKISSLAAGSLMPASALSTTSPQNDLLFVGTQSNLLAYDVDRNADAFFVDVQDGVNALTTGRLGASSKPLVIAGGNCSILGFDAKGTESLWNVTGDNVSSLTLCDMDANNQPVLLVGSDDFEIRVFRGDDLVGEISEADKVTFLRAVSGSKFAYGLANGTVGVYTGSKTRLWRVKTKNKPTALYSYDLDSDGVPEIFSGWSNGLFNVRREETGEVIFKDTMDAPIAGIVSSDYRMDGKEEVMICSEAGEVRAYLSTDVEFGAMLDSGVGKDNASDQKALAELQTQKLELLAEMKLLEKTLSKNKSPEAQVGMLPSNTELTYSLEADLATGALNLKVEVNTDVQIVNLVAVDLEGVVLVDREVLAISPRAQSKVALLPLKPTKNSPCTLRIQTHVATRSLGAQLHVFETDIKVPRFSVFKHMPDNASPFELSSSKVAFTVRESVDRIATWMQSVFLLQHPFKTSGNDNLKVYFVSVCRPAESATKIKTNTQILGDQQSLLVSVSRGVESGQTFAKVRFQCDSMDLAADLTQDLLKFLGVTELESEADFPNELQQFEEVLKVVADCNDARIRLAADMADDSQRIKSLVIRAEDCRLMSDMGGMRRSYTELNALNQQLVGGYNVRASNHDTLLSALKEVNQMIQKAANLRAGKAKSRVVTDCRAAVKQNNMQSLFRIIRQGYEPATAAK